MGRAHEQGKRAGEPPVLPYEAAPGEPLVSTMRLDRELGASEELPGAHSHDFLVLGYLERDGGSLRLGEKERRLEAGDVYLIAPGVIVDSSGLAEATGWAVFFSPEVFGFPAPSTFLSWRAHPLLFPFVAGVDQPGGGARRLVVPLEKRRSWSTRLSVLDSELRERQDGYEEAALAHLTLVLVSVARLAAEVVGDLKLNDEPLLADVFGFIEDRYSESVSLRDVARAVSLTPGYLTTVVRRKTGRTVVEWIAERRLAQARRLLVETDLSVEEVGQGVGYNDPGYFVKSFRRAHGTTPLGWRRAGRP
jgi:AraC family transcriptional regulator, transcriptional activator of pobA